MVWRPSISFGVSTRELSLDRSYRTGVFNFTARVSLSNESDNEGLAEWQSLQCRAPHVVISGEKQGPEFPHVRSLSVIWRCILFSRSRNLALLQTWSSCSTIFKLLRLAARPWAGNSADCHVIIRED